MKRFLCYDTEQAARGEINVDSRGMLKPVDSELSDTSTNPVQNKVIKSALDALSEEMQTWAPGVIQDVNAAGSAAVQSVQSAGDTQVQRVTEEGATQTANAKAQADAAAQSASGAAQSAQEAAESAAVYDTVVADITQLKQDFTNLHKDVETAVKVVVTDKVEEIIVHKSELIYGRVDSANGQIISSSIQSVFELDVTGGDIISTVGYYINSKGDIVRGNGKNILCSYAVDSDGARVASASYSYNSNLPSITIPSGVSKIWFSVTTSGTYASTIVIKTTPNGNVQRIIRQKIDGNPFRFSGSLAANQVVSLGFEHCWTNKVWMFSGRIGTFGTTKIGACDRTGNIVRPYIEVTETSVNLYSTLAGSFDKTFEHGLTISNDLQIIVKQGRTLFVDELIVQSNGYRWSADIKNLRLGEPYYGLGAVSDGTFTNCTVSANILDINKPVWVFGDSWTSLYESRWVWQAVNLGFDKGWLLDGHSGRTTEEALEVFENLIRIRQPKMVVWCMGMNDSDVDDDTPNSSWKNATEEVMRICDKYDIRLVLATIPTVPASQGSYSGTARNNNAKNNYIINSGYRYFDQVSALGADRNGNWIDGYWQSDTDHAHPSEMGARALMAQIFADVPEMLY